MILGDGWENYDLIFLINPTNHSSDNCWRTIFPPSFFKISLLSRTFKKKYQFWNSKDSAGSFRDFLAGILCFSCGEKPDPIPWKIAYNVCEDSETDNYEVYIMNMDGSGKKNITNHPDVAWVYYAWKDKLYFISDRDTCHRCFFI